MSELVAKPRVAQVGRYYNRQGGVSRVMAEISDRLADHYDVDVLSSEHLDVPNNATVNLINVRMLRRPKSLQAPSFAYMVHRNLDPMRYVLVHSHDAQMLNADLYTAHSCFEAYITTQRRASSFIHRTMSRVYPSHLTPIMMARMAYQDRRANIVAVSNSVRNELSHIYQIDEHRLHVIHNGVDENPYVRDRTEARNKVSKVANIHGSETRVVFVGREYRRKRLDTALRGFANSTAVQSGVLLVVGEDKVEREAHDRMAHQLGIGSKVRFLGHREDVQEILAGSDIFLFPTKYEAASLAILEAAAAGLAIVTTDTAMASEVLEDGKSAVLIPNSDDPEPLSRALDRLCADRDLQRRLGASAQNVAAALTWDAIARQYRELYRAIGDERTAKAKFMQ